ncbi:MAG: hypothetical protein E6G55_05650 [Actinobacteria bacterium]|nr:MAG: hypothetical protein E6G61_09770 [Actinomycetota bacterium]TMK46422.1 MAG: hypothetical protein E6G55_05650 [Actinomycetota bacterium]TMK67164.1 MAG: hypothetical protein E6G52_02580 [Actinomycetota bacterium]
MKRLFWLALGLGAGAAGAIMTARFARRQMDKVAPSTLAREARGGLLDLSRRVSESIDEGRRAMQEKEEQLRSESGENRKLD